MLGVAYAADQYSAIFRSTILQLAVPDRLRGRLSAIHFLVVTSGPRFGNFEAGALASATSTEFSVVFGGGAALTGAVLVGLLIPAFVRYDALHEPPPGDEEPDQPTLAAPASNNANATSDTTDTEAEAARSAAP